jgi:hypothetical protein
LRVEVHDHGDVSTTLLSFAKFEVYTNPEEGGSMASETLDSNY